MRLFILNNRIHRAFPELDGYSDERCLGFVRAARGGLLRRLAGIGAIVLVAATILIGGLIGAAMVMNAYFGSVDEAGAMLAIMLIPVIAAPLSGYLTRDLLLWRRIKRILRDHGNCPACGYSLIGLPVSAKSQVVCPECALTCDVDASLGELTLDDGGQARYRPNITTRRPPRIFTPPRVRIIKRAAIWAAIILGAGIPALWGGYELWLRYQAGVARAEKPGVEALMALIEAHQPPASEGAQNAWDVLQEVIRLRELAESAELNDNPREENLNTYADFYQIGQPPDPTLSAQDAAQGARNESLARRLIQYYRDHGLFEAMDRMARAPRAIPSYFVAPERPLWEASFTDLGQMRHFARVNSARMRLARERGDLEEFRAALEAHLALVRIAAYQPLLIGGLTGAAIESMAYANLHETLRSHPPADWLDAIDAAIAGQHAALPPDYAWMGEHLFNLDYACWLFSDPAAVRWGRYSSEIADLTGGMQINGRLGSYAANRDALDALFESVIQRASQARPLRAPPPISNPGAGLLLIQMRLAPGDLILNSFDQAALARAGYRVASALERFRIEHNRYPASLADLVPSFLPELPIDPWTGQPFGCLPRAADADPRDPRGYILYSWGEDRTDNGGLRYIGNQMPALQPSGTGTDYILNDWQPPEEASR